MKNALLTVICALGLGSVATAANQYTYHDYSMLLGVGAEGIALGNACITATEVKSINPVKVCTNLVPVEVRDPASDSAGTRTEWVCQSYAYQQLSAPRSFKREICTVYAEPRGESDGGPFCLEHGVKDDFLPATIKIATVTETNGETGSDFPGVVSTFTFPACQ